MAGKIGLLIKAIDNTKAGDDGVGDKARSRITHGIYRISFLSPSTLAFRQRREEGVFNTVNSKADLDALNQNEKEFLERMKKRLSIRKINAWLDEQGGKDHILIPEKLITGEDSYIRFIYALLYGDSRKNFGYAIENAEETDGLSIKAADYIVPDIKFRKNKEYAGDKT